MSDTMPWQGYLAIGFVVLFVGGVALIVLYAFLEGWWLSCQIIPSRFEELQTESNFDTSALPEIAQQLGMKQADQIPNNFSRQVLDAMPPRWNGADFLNILIRTQRDGVSLLCNVRRSQEVVVGDSSGEGQTRRYREVDSLIVTAFLQSEGPYLPTFSTRPLIDYLSVRLVRFLSGKWYGAPRFPDDPSFHERLLISTNEPDRVRLVLTEPVRRVLKDNCDLTTSVSGPIIVVYDDGHPVKHIVRGGPADGERIENCRVLAARDWPRFFRAADNIIQTLKPTRE